ncbi:hypothetical protein V5799_004928 [Amblyomma americanum]|uniref:Uncharacterized protein n=1 Tax=Amblyomma americanum TaxID=6943 RepID=A0AAQ4D4Q1_AMBAM
MKKCRVSPVTVVTIGPPLEMDHDGHRKSSSSPQQVTPLSSTPEILLGGQTNFAGVHKPPRGRHNVEDTDDEGDVRRADLRFLEEAFLTPAKFGNLEVVELLCKVQQQTGLTAAKLNSILRECDDGTVSKTCGRVDVFIEGAERPTQRTRPWCRSSNYYFFADLDFDQNVDYAMRLMAFLAPDPNDHRWQRKELADASGPRTKQARLWARNFKRSLRKGKYDEPCGEGCN